MSNIKLKKEWIRDYLYVLIGALLIAVAVNWIFVPNRTVTGGVSGIGIVLYYVLGIPISVTSLLLNIPLFILGWKYLGGHSFGFKTLVGTLSVSLFIQLTTPLAGVPLTREPLLASIYGGILLGVGIGIVFRGRATTGGTDLIARLFQRWTGQAPGILLLAIDGMVIASAAAIFNADRILFALISLFVTGKTINLVQEGITRARMAYIISDRHEQVQQALLYQLDAGVTAWQSMGGYTGNQRNVLLCVIEQSQVTEMKEIVRQVDEKAFVIMTDAHEVLGEGFNPIRS